MTFTNPNITLSGKDGWTLSIGNESIIVTSFKEEQKLMNGLSPSGNKVGIEISDWNKVSEIMTRSEDLKATLCDGSTPVFTGYLSNKSTWQLTDSGIKKMSLTLEDVGTRLLGKTFLPDATGDEFVDCKLFAFVQRICDRCGIVLSSASARDVSIRAIVNGKSTCKDILNQVMKETGYVYSFDSRGRMYLYQIPSSAVSSHTFDNSNLWTVGQTAVKSDRNIRKYERTRLEFDEYESVSSASVYRDISGKDDEYRNCKILIPSKTAYPDRENGLPSKYECTDLQTGKEIVSISNITPIVECIGKVDYSITKTGAKEISVLIENKTSTDATVTKLEALADIIRIKGNTIILSGEAVEDSDSDNVYEMKLSYIHNKADAEETAKVLDWYYKYSDYSYEFYSKDSVDIGSVVRINDNTLSGLDVTVLITERIRKGNTDIITYRGVAYSPFKTTVIKDTTINRPPVIIDGGQDGKDGQPGKDGEPGEDAKQFLIKSYSGNFIKDLRNTGTQSIRVNVYQSGYAGDLLLESSSGTVTGENGSYLVTVPMNLNTLVLNAYSIIPSAGEYNSSIYYFSKDSEGKYSHVEATAQNYLSYYMAEAWDMTEIHSVDKTSYKKYVGVYDNVSNIPTSDSEGLVINGDYALIRYDANGKFALTAYEKINEVWLISSDPMILAETTSDAVNEAKIEYEKGGEVNYIDLFYSHRAYIDNLSSTVINVSDLYTGDIQSFEYAEDENGYPASGYKLEYKGGTDGKGMIKTVGLTAKNCTFSNSTIERDCQVYGTIVNKDGDDNTVLKTVQETVPVTTMSASKTDGVSKPDAFLWSDYKALIKNRITGRTADTVYSCTANINGKAFKSYCNKTTARTIDEIPSHPSYHIGNYGDAEVYYDYPFDYANGEIFYLRANKSVFTLTIPPNYPIVTIRRFWVDPDSQGVNGGKNYRSYHGAFTVTLENSTTVTMLASGNEVEITPEMYASGNYPPVEAKFENLVMHPGETLRVTFYVIQRQFTSTEVPPDRRKMNANVYFSIVESDIWTTGTKLIDTDGYIYEADSVIPSGGWGTTAQVFNDSGVNYSLNMVADSSWAIRKYYRFQWNSAPPNTSNKTSSFIDDGSYLEYNGVHYYSSGIGSATYGSSGLTIVTSSGTSFPFVVGNYYSQYSILIKTRDSLPGVYAKNLMPIDTASHIGGADSSHLWHSIYCNTIYSNNSAPVSKRSLKENIREWEGNATDLLNQVDVVEFNYISDPDKTYHIGFIADDTDERIAGKDHDRMDTTNCIGVLIRAIQELSDKVAKLESQTNSNGSGL